MKSSASQGRRLIELLKKRSLTSMQLQMTGISTCWHKRVAEALRLMPEWRLISGVVDPPRANGRAVKRYTVVPVRSGR